MCIFYGTVHIVEGMNFWEVIDMNMALELFLIMIVMTISNTAGTLRTIFTARKFLKPVYIIVFIDAVIFAAVISKVTAGGEYLYILAFAIGKVLGVFVGGIIEEKIALGIIEADIMVNNKDKMKMISDTLRENGFSVNTIVTYGIQGSKRYVIEVTAKRKEIRQIKKLLANLNYENPTMVIKEVSNISGKICKSECRKTTI